MSKIFSVGSGSFGTALAVSLAAVFLLIGLVLALVFVRRPKKNGEVSDSDTAPFTETSDFEETVAITEIAEEPEEKAEIAEEETPSEEE